MPLEGQQIGRYRLQRILGSGGMGEVYLATDTLINRQVAVKVIKTEGITFSSANVTKEANRLFHREMKAITALDHPHILPVFDYGESQVNDTTITYMVMPYRSEGSLTQWLQRRGRTKPLLPQEVADIINQAAGALQHAHSRQIIHQDVKPGNFLIHGDEENPNRPNLLLADFGVAKFSSSTASIDVSVGSSVAIRGTPSYMAPEQWEGHPVPATDQYALAVMAYELLTGRAPFQGNLSQMMYQHLRTAPAPASTFNRGIPATIDAVLLRALAKKPEERFLSIYAFARAFEQAVQNISASNKADISASDSDLRAILAISKSEALNGTSRTLTLPGGQQVNVPIPSGAQNGQVIYLGGLGGSSGSLILTLLVQQAEEINEQPLADDMEKTVGVSKPELQSPPIPASNPDLRSPVSPAPPPPYLQSPTTPVVPSDPNFQSPTTPVMPSDPNFQSPTTPVELHQDLQNPVEPASHFNVQQPITPAFSQFREIPRVASINREGDGSRSSSSKRKVILLTALALLIIASFAGLFYFIHTNQVTADNASATAQVNATSTAAANATSSALAYATATASVIAANPDPYLHGQGRLALYDPLHDNSHGYGWDQHHECSFAGGAYHVNIPNLNFTDSCVANSTDFSNFVFEVQMTIIRGDCGGIVFREDRVTGKRYYFEVCQDGHYVLVLYVNNTGTNAKRLISNFSSVIHTGLNQVNLLAVVANGSKLDLYVNKQKIVSLSDTSFNHGLIGVAAYSPHNPTEVAYSNARVWML